MNIERFHALVASLADELETTKVTELMTQLAQGLRQMSQDPSQPAYQQQVSNARSGLLEALNAAPSNGYSPGWRQSLEELEVGSLVGTGLSRLVEDVLARNELTATTAADELEPLAERVQALTTACKNVLDGLRFFDIDTEDLNPGEFEISFLIPRAEVDEELGELGHELEQIKRLLGPLLELSIGARPNVTVRSISSSAFEIFLVSAPATALVVAKVIESLVTSYEKLTNIRVSQQQLEDDGVPAEALAPVKRHANELMEREIDGLVEELLTDAQVADNGRRNELKIELTISLNGLANRIDRGYGVDVRAGELPEPEEDVESTPQEKETRTAANEVLSRQQRLRFLKLDGKPILALPEATDEAEPGA